MVITDIMMPIMDGFALAKRIREQSKTLPILFMTAKDDKPSQQLGFALVKKVIDVLGGKITVTSTLGKGTEFGIMIGDVV
jgi:CheY-like chemotaxis protein